MTIDVSIELLLDGTWTDISGDVLQRDRVQITRGRRNEGSKTDPGKCQLTIDNTGGTYSPRNPESPLYGQIGRNTPLRVRQGVSDVALSLPGVEPAHASTPDDAALGITGDIDIRMELTPYSWRPDASWMVLAAKAVNNGAVSWGLRLMGSGTLELAWSDGTNRTSAGSTDSVPTGSGRLAVRATLDVDNGSSGHTITFYTASGIGGTWSQLGSAVTNSGTTSVSTSSADLTLGSLQDGEMQYPEGAPLDGVVHGFELRNGIDGTVVAGVGFGSAAPGDSTFSDDAGLAWTVRQRARLTDTSLRFVGEVSEWPPRWDVTGSDVHTPIEAAGILRRLGNVNSPLRSPLYRGTVASEPVAYWPLEDGDNSTTLASALDDGSPMSIVRSPKLADFDGFVASNPVPTMQDGEFVGVIPEYPYSSESQVQMMLRVPDGGISATAQYLELRTTGSARRWQVLLQPDGDIEIEIRDAIGVELYAVTGAFNANGTVRRFSLQLTQNGSDVDWMLVTLDEGADQAGTLQGTLTGHTVGAMQRVVVGSSGLGDVAIGHVSARPQITSIFDLTEESNAYQGEAAGRRIERLCGEQNIPLALTGTPDDTAALGPQSSDTLLGLLREAAGADMGILGELRDQVGLHFRTHESLYNRTPALTLDYQAEELSPPLEPTEDDKNTANDVTVQRRDGSSSRAVQTSGPLSVQPPPQGVGRYDSSVTLNLHTDEQTTQQAAWRMHRGTMDELRYPVLTLLLHGQPHLIDTVKQLDVGDRVVVQNVPDWLPPGEVDVTLEGTSENLNTFEWSWSVNTSPARAHDVFELNSPTLGRLASEGSELNAAIDSTQTTFDVAVTAGELWTTDSADFPFDIEVGGEVMTVSGISGTSSPQTFTVTRSVNGIVKSHNAGTEVQLYQPGVLALGQSGADL